MVPQGSEDAANDGNRGVQRHQVNATDFLCIEGLQECWIVGEWNLLVAFDIVYIVEDLEQYVDVPTMEKHYCGNFVCCGNTCVHCTVMYYVVGDRTGLKWNCAGGTFPVHL